MDSAEDMVKVQRLVSHMRNVPGLAGTMMSVPGPRHSSMSRRTEGGGRW
jgi:hypothetical protein